MVAYIAQEFRDMIAQLEITLKRDVSFRDSDSSLELTLSDPDDSEADNDVTLYLSWYQINGTQSECIQRISELYEKAKDES